MLIFHGAAAISDFRQGQLSTALGALIPSVRAVRSAFIHFVELSDPLSQRQAEVLESLLRYGPRRHAAVEPTGKLLLAIPRPGTISPWASKATDIARNVGLHCVHRIERGIAYYLDSESPLGTDEIAAAAAMLHDRMVEVVVSQFDDAAALFVEHSPRALTTINILVGGRPALEEANTRLGLALVAEEIDYLLAGYLALGRDPTDVELMMFAQANSEHCRHKIFNATWTLDGERQPHTLFGMIKNTFVQSSDRVLSAYADNAAVVVGSCAGRFFPDLDDACYRYHPEPVHLLMKVETHNHPTAIAPFPGAGTGAGGEIRDEGAVGRGSKPKAGLTGFSVSNLQIPDYLQPWEHPYGKPDRIVSALTVMLEGPVGAAAFNNEFGRPNLCGYFRSFEMDVAGERRGYHKPIMIAGGYGNIRPEHIAKEAFSPGARLIVLGGPAMLIGLGDGAASSMGSGSSAEALDFASVQRQNPEMQRRCQEVIDRCWQLGAANPIVFIHDVGAGGLSNALPELVKDGGCGGAFELRAIPCDEPGMSPLEIWCNEAQERYVLAVMPEDLERFAAICARERCPHAIVGIATETRQLVVSDNLNSQKTGVAPPEARPVDVPMALLFGKSPGMHRNASSRITAQSEFTATAMDLNEAIERVLRHPAVACKSFLITIGDRSVTGLVVRDQMVGPWQVPVADCAVTAVSFDSYAGEAMAMGERAPLALLNGPAAARMAVGEAITNIAATRIGALPDIKLSANWMCAAGHPGEDAELYHAVAAVGLDLCPALGITIPVGKDSLSMRTTWREAGVDKAVTAPLSLVISAFAPVLDVRKTLTPQLRTDCGETQLLLIDLGGGQARLGASILAQVYGQLGAIPPDLDAAERLKSFFNAMQASLEAGDLLAYHDRSDGGLLTTLAEMSFAGHCGVSVRLPSTHDPLATLFAEELGAVVQVRAAAVDIVVRRFEQAGLTGTIHLIGTLNDRDVIECHFASGQFFRRPRAELQRVWAETSNRLQALRDNPACARQEYDGLLVNDPGLSARLTFDPQEDITATYLNLGAKPRVAILREQGVNGQVEMAAAFDRAGFAAIDVHMSDILAARVVLDDFKGIAACGGFSYGDVLGAGEGWAKTILFNPRARAQFEAFFARPDSFSLGVCNGCQMLSNLKELIPGAALWPHFVRNLSEQFEARAVLVRIEASPSVLLTGMAGSHLPVAVAHGEGRAEFVDADAMRQLELSAQAPLRYIDNQLTVTEIYPANPNGSPAGIAGVTSADGRVTLLMPHPERSFRTINNSWYPRDWGEDGAWLRLFRNARSFVQ